MSSLQKEPEKSTAMWIHCNRCFENYSQKQRKVFILSCYDVVCETCVCRVSQSDMKCPICNKTVRSFAIGNDLPTSLKEFFHPRPWTMGFPKAWAIVKFQTKQRDNFLLGCRKMAEYNRSLEKERDRVKGECRQAYMLQQKTKAERKRIEAALKKLKSNESACQSLDVSRSSRRSDFFIHHIPRTYHAPQNEETFDFPSDSHMSKSFIL